MKSIETRILEAAGGRVVLAGLTALDDLAEARVPRQCVLPAGAG